MSTETPPDWRAFQAARERFFAQVRPQAMQQLPQNRRQDAALEHWSLLEGTSWQSRDGVTGQSGGSSD